MQEQPGAHSQFFFFFMLSILYLSNRSCVRLSKSRVSYTCHYPSEVRPLKDLMLGVVGCFFGMNRQRKDELEQRMSALQESRRELMVQLEGLMKLLKVPLHTNSLLDSQHKSQIGILGVQHKSDHMICKVNAV